MYQHQNRQQEEQLITTERTVYSLTCEICHLEGLAEKGLVQDYFALSELYESKQRLERIIALSEAQSLSCYRLSSGVM